MHTYTAAEIAATVLRRSLQSFQNRRAELERAGFPKPLNIPGHPLWLASDIHTWLESRRAAPKIDERAESKAVAPVGPEKATVAPATPVKRGRGRPRKMPGGAQ